jgi:transposase
MESFLDKFEPALFDKVNGGYTLMCSHSQIWDLCPEWVVEYVHTPKHGSWLNLIECAFSKMSRTFLRHIRVNSVDELKARILKGIDEFNASPVIFRWNKFDLGVV